MEYPSIESNGLILCPTVLSKMDAVVDEEAAWYNVFSFVIPPRVATILAWCVVGLVTVALAYKKYVSPYGRGKTLYSALFMYEALVLDGTSALWDYPGPQNTNIVVELFRYVCLCASNAHPPDY